MTAHEILSSLRTKTFGRKVFSFEVLDSTNVKAKTLASEGAEHGSLVITDTQTHGRGRLGRTWIAEPGKNLTFSLILRPGIPIEKLGLISLYGGVAVARAVARTTPLKPICKWPNDVLLDGRKFCGILSESLISNDELSAVVVGVGINVNQTRFPAEIETTATSLSLQLGKPLDRFDVLSSVLLEMEELYDLVQNLSWGHIIQLWKEKSTMLGREVSVSMHDTIIHGIASGISDDGALVIRRNGDEVRVLAGDVTVLR